MFDATSDTQVIFDKESLFFWSIAWPKITIQTSILHNRSCEWFIKKCKSTDLIIKLHTRL